MDNQLQQKLSAFEAAPPKAMWERIAVALDEQPAFAARLQDYSEAPSELVWKRIDNELNDALPAKVIPLRTRYRTHIRYASAAAIIGVVLIINTLVSKRTEAGALDGSQQGAGQLTPPTKQQTATANAEWVTYTDGDGATMQMPKQLFDALQCKNGDNTCRKRIAEMRKKLSSSNTTSDFSGLLEMLRQLK